MRQFQLIKSVLRTQPTRPKPSISHSASLPPTSFRDLQNTPDGRPRQTSRRHSDRIRAPSDSSSSSEEDENATQRLNHSSDQAKSTSFPISGTAGQPPPRLFPRRTKTLSDPSKRESPLAARVRGAQPPSAFNGLGGFARPSPASRRRRGSSGTQSANGDESYDTSDRSFPRSVSQTSVTAPMWLSREERGSSPLSPSFGVDSTSFHRAKSPKADGLDGLDNDGTQRDEEDIPEEEDQIGELEMQNARLSRMTVGYQSDKSLTPDRIDSFASLVSRQATGATEAEYRVGKEAEGV
jgi:hypothetical protein